MHKTKRTHPISSKSNETIIISYQSIVAVARTSLIDRAARTLSRNMITVAKLLLMFIICKVHQLLITKLTTIYIYIMMKVLIVLLSIFAFAQSASLRGSSSFLEIEDDNYFLEEDNYGQCISGCNDLDTEERKICQAGCNDEYPQEAYGACLSRCKRLRIAPGHCTCDVPEEPTKEPLEDSSSGDEDGSTDRTADDEDYESCIVSCSEDYDTESSEFGQCRTECNIAYSGDITTCQSRCWRLRLTRDGQVDCIVDCSADDEDDTDADGVSNPNRSADDEQEEDVSMDEERSSTPNEEDKPPVDNPCKRRCDMLKIAPGPRRDACFDRCPTDDFYVRVS